MPKHLVIYGAGGLGREIKSMLPETTEPFDLLGFVDDGLETGTMVDNVPVFNNLWLAERDDVSVVAAIGHPKRKAELIARLSAIPKIKFATIVHARAILQNPKSIHLGVGTVIGAGCVLTTDIAIGEHVLLNLNTTIGHDTSIGDYTSIMPGVNISGNVKLGQGVMVGAGANIINLLEVGEWSTIGAGSVVNHNVPAHVTTAGVPARIIR